MRDVEFRAGALKFVKKLMPKHQQQIKNKIKELQENPVPPDSIILSGYKPHHRCDVGEYRIVYRFDESVVHISLIGKRNDGAVYNELRRLFKV